MKNIFILQSSGKFLKKYIAQIPVDAPIHYFLGKSAPSTINTDLSNYGWKEVEIEQNADLKERFLSNYLDLVASLNELNGANLYWWATHLSSKNSLNSSLLPYLQELQQILMTIETLPRNETLVLIDIEWTTVEAIRKIVSEIDDQLQVFSPAFANIKVMLWKNFRFWKIFLTEVIFSFLIVYKTKKNFKKSSLHFSNSPIYLIKSFTYNRSFKKDSYEDPFFGELPNYFKEKIKNFHILTVALGFQDKFICYQKMNNLKNHSIYPLENYLTYWDILKRSIEWIWFLNRHSFKIPNTFVWMNYDITDSFKRWIKYEGFQIAFFQTLHFDIAKRLGKLYNIQTCLMTYEGCPWERFFIEGMKKSSPHTLILGYQHAVIPLSASGMFLHEKEKSIIPLPDQIITTGPIPKQILAAYSSYPKDRIHIGCALRFESLQKLPLLPRKKLIHNKKEKKFTLLIAFGGSKEEVPLLDYVLQQTQENLDIVFRARTHPTFSFEQLYKHSLWKNRNLPENLETSIEPTVIEDLKNCDAVLYWGTTVSLEALMMGKPIIQFDRGDFLNYDPLFEFQDFKWQVKNDYSLEPILKEIQTIPELQYKKLQKKGQEYVKSYFYSVNPERLSLFLPTTVYSENS